jgi:uncharacterized protein
MKGLGVRLRRAVGGPPASIRASSLLREGLHRVGDAQRRREASHEPIVDLEAACGGQAIDTPYGPVWVISHHLPLETLHGERPVGGFFTRSIEDAERLTGDARLGPMCPEDACFLDIEATGLEHGAGTMAFLVGVAFRQGDTLVTRQYLLREPCEERALLHCLLQDLDAHPMLVTFNGKSYDLSVLETRMVICRFLDKSACRLKLRPHLDLLHLSRNLHRGRWQDTRLGTLEDKLLGFHRIDDLPGALVPSAWFHFLRTTDATALGQAVTHNLHDVWSMVVLADHLLETGGLAAQHDVLPPRVSANLGHLLVRRHEFHSAVETLTPFLTLRHVESSVRQQALKTLAIAARRSQQTPVELTALEQLHALCPTDTETLTRLAIALERRAKDIGSALNAAREVHRLSPAPTSLRRVRRLEAKLARARSVAC